MASDEFVNPTLTAGNFRARFDEATEVLNHLIVKPEVQALPEVYEVLGMLGEMVLMTAAAAHQALLRAEDTGSGEATIGR